MKSRIVALMVIVAGAVFGISTPAFAEERVCRGSLGAITVDNLRVPQNATCTLSGTYVKGTVKVENGAKLYAKNVKVIGNVQSENAARVEVLAGSRVGGSIQIKQGAAARINRVTIGQDLQFDANSRALAATRNTIGGNLQAFQNTGGLTISYNNIGGNLQCKENRPAPIGTGNIVDGNKEDQCSRL